MPAIEEKVHSEEGKARKIITTLTFYPEDSDNLESSEMIAGIPDHWSKDGGFFRPDPESINEEQFIKVYIQSYDRDDSNPAAKKRHIVVVEILDYEETNSGYLA
jgi:hypothetical protein